MKNADNPAMPLSGDAYQDFAHYDGTPKTGYNPECQGLTKREMFAMNAMQGLIAANSTYGGRTDNRALLAADAIAHADALLKELDK